MMEPNELDDALAAIDLSGDSSADGAHAPPADKLVSCDVFDAQLSKWEHLLKPDPHKTEAQKAAGMARGQQILDAMLNKDPVWLHAEKSRLEQQLKSERERNDKLEREMAVVKRVLAVAKREMAAAKDAAEHGAREMDAIRTLLWDRALDGLPDTGGHASTHVSQPGGADEDDDVECTGERTREERDAEGRKNAVVLEEDEDE